MGRKNHASTTPSTQRKRRAESNDKEGGKKGEGRAGKRAAVEVNQEIPEVGESKAFSRWILTPDDVEQIDVITGGTEDLEEAGVWMFENLREGGELTDMEFVLDSGRRIRGHKAWLMARCEYIRAMMSSGMKEAKTGIVPVRECSDGGFMALLEYIYTGRIGKMCHGQDWGELWEIAHLFGMPGMVKGLMSSTNIYNVEEAALVAVERGIVPLMEACVCELTFTHEESANPMNESSARSMIRTMDLLVQHREATSWELTSAGIRVILVAMEQLEDDASMLEMACAILADVTGRRGSGEVNHLDCLQMGGIDCIMDALDKHRTHNGLQDHGWKVMENCGAHALMDAMNDDAYIDDWWVQQHCCKAVHRIANVGQLPLQSEESGGEASSSAVTEIKDMVSAVIESIRPKGNDTNPLNMKEVEPVLKALSNFGAEAVVAAMNAYSSDAWVQQLCCRALAGILGPSVNALNTAISTVVWKEGGVEAVLSAMKFHGGSAEVQVEACLALCAMEDTVIVEEGQSIVAKKGRMFCAIMEAVEMHKGNHLLLKKALKGLICLCDDIVERDLRVAGVALDAIKALGNRNVQVAACQALKQLCEDSFGCEVRRFVVDADGVETVVKALVANESNLYMQGYYCQVLAELCMDDDARDRAGDCGGVEAVVKLILEGVANGDEREEAWQEAGNALRMLCVGYERDAGNRSLAWAAADDILGEGGSVLVFEAFRDWVDQDSDDEPGFYSSDEDNYRYTWPDYRMTDDEEEDEEEEDEDEDE